MITKTNLREGIRTELTFSVEDTEYFEIGNHFVLKGKAITKLLEYLHSQGVVLKVEGELPVNSDVPEKYNDFAFGAEDDSDNISKAFYELAQQDMLKAGYTLTKSLLEENR